MADSAHIETDKRLARMEKRLTKIYDEAEKEIEAKAAAYFDQFKKLDEAKRKQVQNGTLSEEDYKRWRKDKLVYGNRWVHQRTLLAQDYANVRSTALAYINDQLPEVYSVNYNYTQTGFASQVRGYSFDLVNPDTVRELAKEDVTFLPYKEVNLRKYQRWCTQKINSEILKGVLMGDSIPNLAKRLRTVSTMDRNAAVRNARTMVTSAENKARQDGFERATDNGIIFKREWIATRDSRTRDTHVYLNGQFADPDEPFHSDLGDIMYPGDPSAHPANVYNCRCTLGSKIIGFKKQNGSGEVLIPDAESGIIDNGRGISSRQMANGARKPALHPLTDSEIELLREDIRAIGADESVFEFNKGFTTSYVDKYDKIYVRGDILPDENSTHPRDKMSSRAVLAHEYYGHRAYRGTKLNDGAWNDEFRASYAAAKNAPGLTDEDKRYLILDALERAKESGVSIKYNKFIRRVIYGE